MGYMALFCVMLACRSYIKDAEGKGKHKSVVTQENEKSVCVCVAALQAGERHSAGKEAVADPSLHRTAIGGEACA